jgi:hypothetical protein
LKSPDIINQIEEKLRKRRDAERIAKEEFFVVIEENKLREKYAGMNVYSF